VSDPLSGFLSSVINGSAFLVLIHSRRVVQGELGGRSVPLYATAMLMLGGVSGMVITCLVDRGDDDDDY
jgi:formate hydrogenlyase subunit 3/multisubunit Na+/H+ antiporter MnhD subunit